MSQKDDGKSCDIQSIRNKKIGGIKSKTSSLEICFREDWSLRLCLFKSDGFSESSFEGVESLFLFMVKVGLQLTEDGVAAGINFGIEDG